jgi:GNAT superfamily N-acetyltransferase
MQFRRITKSDLDDVLALDHQVFIQNAVQFKWLRTTCASTATEAFLMDSHGAVIGYMIGVRDGHAVEIVRMCVMPTAQRNGIGKVMIGEFSVAVGADTSLESRGRGDWAKFLEACRFKPVLEYPGGQKLYRRGWRFKRAPALEFRGVKQ